MKRRAGLSAAIGLIAGSVLVTMPPAAAEGTLELSSAEIATGGVLSVSGSGCTSQAAADRSVRSLLLIGEPGSQTVAAFADGPDGAPAPLGVPGWVDTNASAEVRASCVEHGADGSLSTVFAYEPLGVDVVPGTGPSPSATPVRADLIEGQATAVTVGGCDNASGAKPEAYLFAGGDLSGQDWTDPVAAAELGDSPDELAVGPFGYDGHVLAPGSYVLAVQCGLEGAGFAAPPLVVTVLPNDAAGTAAVSLSDDGLALRTAGAGCFGQQVTVTFVAVPSGTIPERSRAARIQQARSIGAVSTQVVDPLPDGTWSATWEPELRNGYVIVYAQCGDPFGAGFAYTGDEGPYELAEEPTITTTTATQTPVDRTPRAARAVRGRVSYAG